MSTINADTSNGLKFTSNTSGEIKLQSAGADIATVNSSGITMASGKTISGGEIIQNSGPTFKVNLGSEQSIDSATWTKLTLKTEAWDTNSNYDNVTNYRFTPTVAGYYHFSGAFFIPSLDYVRLLVALRKNGNEVMTNAGISTSSNGGSGIHVSGLQKANGTTDYFELWAYQETGLTKLINQGAQLTWFDGHLVRAL